MKDFSKNILHTIEQEQIAPRPRWIFIVRQAALFFSFILSVFIGGASVAVILFSVADLDWDAPRMMNAHPGPFLITYLPYVWVIALILFGIIAYYEVRYTKGGYRYRAATLLGASFLASLVVGGVMHVIGAGQIIERRFSAAIPQYQGLEARKMNLWMRPGDGMLAGKIVSGSATSTFILEDFSGAQWTVDATDATLHGTLGVDAPVRVRVIGSATKPGIFHAEDVFSWTRRGGASGMGPGMMPEGGAPRMLIRVPQQGGMLYMRQAGTSTNERIEVSTP